VNTFSKARALALALPASLMAGALGSQYIGGLYPCEMCMWQRWPHDVAIVLALFAFAFRKASMDQLMVFLAAVAILVSGAIGAFHAGVEYGWWEGVTRCAVTARGVTIEDIMRAPVVRCDHAPWTLAGVSLAGFNALFSLGGGGLVLWWIARARKGVT
jgi:disulfide bond formation protein DsbB